MRHEARPTPLVWAVIMLTPGNHSLAMIYHAIRYHTIPYRTVPYRTIPCCANLGRSVHNGTHRGVKNVGPFDWGWVWSHKKLSLFFKCYRTKCRRCAITFVSANFQLKCLTISGNSSQGVECPKINTTSSETKHAKFRWNSLVTLSSRGHRHTDQHIRTYTYTLGNNSVERSIHGYRLVQRYRSEAVTAYLQLKTNDFIQNYSQQHRRHFHY